MRRGTDIMTVGYLLDYITSNVEIVSLERDIWDPRKEGSIYATAYSGQPSDVPFSLVKKDVIAVEGIEGDVCIFIPFDYDTWDAWERRGGKYNG